MRKKIKKNLDYCIGWPLNLDLDFSVLVCHLSIRPGMLPQHQAHTPKSLFHVPSPMRYSVDPIQPNYALSEQRQPTQ